MKENCKKNENYLKKKDYKQARKIAQDIHSKRKDAPSYSLLGGVELAAGNVVKAKAYLSQAVQKDPNFAPALLNLARIELQEGKITLAKTHFQAVINKDSNNLTALMGLAQINEKEGNIKSAVAYLQEAKTKNDTAVLPRILLARYFGKAGDVKAALDNASEAYKIAPKDGVVALLMANAHMVNRDATKAIEVLKTLKLEQPKAPIVAYELARAYLGVKQVTKARDEFKRALSINPKYYQAKVALARLEITDGNHDNALKEAKSLQSLQPKEAMGCLLEGDILGTNRKYRQAESAYRKSIQIKASPQGYEKLAKALLAQKKAKQSINELKAGMAAFPKSTVLKIQVATIYQTNNQKSEAISIYDKLLQSHPDHAVVLNNLALLYLDNGDVRALDYAKKAYTLIPSNPGIADTLGWVYARQGDFEHALPLLKKAASETKIATIQYHYAFALAQSKRRTEARRVLEKALQDTKYFDERTDAEILMKSLTK